MARSHFLLAWTIVFGFLAAATLSAADEPLKTKRAKEPKVTSSIARKKLAKTPAKQPQSYVARELPPGGNVAAIEKALASTTQLDFSEAPLQEVIDYLKDAYKIEIQLDKRVLEDVNISGDTPVTINVKGISLKSALRLMLRNMQPELAYMIKDEVLMITTPDIEDEHHVTRVYPVGDLVACRDEHDAPWDDYDSLIDLITSTIQPARLGTDYATGFITGNTFGTAKILVVTHTDEMHEKIADLLTKLREIAKNNPNTDAPRRNRPTSTPHGKMRERKTSMSGGGMMGGGMGGGMF